MGETAEKPLRRGWTTGACATAAARAAYTALVSGRFPNPVTIRLPKGRKPSFPLAEQAAADGWALAGVVKDAGDDPDVTHGALVRATLRRGREGAGVTFRAGEGVGTVTRPGLPVAVGEPAINPAPRRMIAEAVAVVAEEFGASGDVEVEVSIPGGAELAARTMNGRLGVEGGLSILGTTGVVVPYSCASWIASILQGVDVARAAGLRHVAGATGSVSEAAVQRLYGLPDQALIDMGDFAGGLLKHLRRHPVPRLTIAGGFGKLAKLAAGHLDLHSGRSRVDPAFLADLLARLGADAALVERARTADSAAQVLDLASVAGLPLANAVAEGARRVAAGVAGPKTAIEILVFDRGGELIGHSERI